MGAAHGTRNLKIRGDGMHIMLCGRRFDVVGNILDKLCVVVRIHVIRVPGGGARGAALAGSMGLGFGVGLRGACGLGRQPQQGV
jgi:hypothetical protein